MQKININDLHTRVNDGLRCCLRDCKGFPMWDKNCPYSGDLNCVRKLTADIQTVFYFVYMITETLAKDFGSPCDHAGLADTMCESEWCERDCGKLTDAQCWLRYFEYLMTKKVEE